MRANLDIATILLSCCILGEMTRGIRTGRAFTCALEQCIREGHFPELFGHNLHFIDGNIERKCPELREVVGNWFSLQAAEHVNEANDWSIRLRVSTGYAYPTLTRHGISLQDAERWGRAFKEAYEREMVMATV